MDLHQRQQFDFLLGTAVERYVERLQQRNQGAAGALEKLKSDRNSDGVWLDDFVDAIFQDFLLDNVEGACFILQALAKRPHDAMSAGRIGDSMITLAKLSFGNLLESKTIEALQQVSSYQSVDAGGH